MDGPPLDRENKEERCRSTNNVERHLVTMVECFSRRRYLQQKGIDAVNSHEEGQRAAEEKQAPPGEPVGQFLKERLEDIEKHHPSDAEADAGIQGDSHCQVPWVYSMM